MSLGSDGLAEAPSQEHAMLPSTTFAALDYARQRQEEIARRVRNGHVELVSSGRWRRRRRRGR